MSVKQPDRRFLFNVLAAKIFLSCGNTGGAQCGTTAEYSRSQASRRLKFEIHLVEIRLFAV